MKKGTSRDGPMKAVWIALACIVLFATLWLTPKNARVNPHDLPVINCRTGDFHWGLLQDAEGFDCPVPSDRSECDLKWCARCGCEVCTDEEAH